MTVIESPGFIDTVTASWLSFTAMQKVLTETVSREFREQTGIHLDDYEILAFLYASAGQRARMSEIAEAVIAPKSRLTYQVDQLAKRLYLVRTDCLQDRRGLFAELTFEGAELVEQATPVYSAVITENFSKPVGQESMYEMLLVSNRIRRHSLSKFQHS